MNEKENNSNVILNDGDQLCFQCNGKRVVHAYNTHSRKTVEVLCGACLGKGKLDWLEMVTGAKDDHLNQFENLDSCSCSSSQWSTSSSQNQIEVVATIHSFGKIK
jgi:hypothetical protein